MVTTYHSSHQQSASMTYGRRVRDWAGEGTDHIGRPTHPVDLPLDSGTELGPKLRMKRNADDVSINALKQQMRERSAGLQDDDEQQ